MFALFQLDLADFDFEVSQRFVSGMAGWPGWMVDGLVAKDAIGKSVNEFVGSVITSG